MKIAIDFGAIKNSTIDIFHEQCELDPATGCRLWMGSVHCSGYGQISFRHKRRNVTFLTHRFAWLIQHGHLPEGLYVLHHCDVYLCANHEHLFLGTQQDNMSDLVRKNLQVRGEAIHGARLTADDVVAIRKARASGRLLREIAAEFSVHEVTIHDIIHGKTWRHVPGGAK